MLLLIVPDIIYLGFSFKLRQLLHSIWLKMDCGKYYLGREEFWSNFYCGLFLQSCTTSTPPCIPQLPCLRQYLTSRINVARPCHLGTVTLTLLTCKNVTNMHLLSNVLAIFRYFYFFFT